MGKDLEFFSDELMAELINKALKGEENKKTEKEADEGKNATPSKTIPENFTFAESEKKELKSLEEKIAREIATSGQNLDEIRRYGKFLATTKTMPKAEYCERLAKALCTPLDFFSYYDYFSDEAKKVFLDLAFKPFVTKNEVINKVFGKSSRGFYFYMDSAKLPMSFIISYSYKNIISLPPNTKRAVQIMLSKILPPKEPLTDEIFKNSEGFFSDEEGLEFFRNLPQIIQVLSDSGFFEREIGSPILKGTLSKIMKIHNFSGFAKNADFSEAILKISSDKTMKFNYPEKTKERLENARTTLFLSFLSMTVNQLMKRKSGKEKLISLMAEPEKLLRELLKIFFTSGDYIFDKKILYPHVTLRYYYEDDLIDYRKEAMEKIQEAIKKSADLNPLEFSNYVTKLEKNGLPPLFSKNVDAETTISHTEQGYYEDSFYTETERVFINNPVYYKALVQEPACTNLFLLLASLGLFEITWHLPCERPKDIYDSATRDNDLNQYRFGKIGAIKMTALGAYTFGLTDTLSVKGIKQFAPPRLDDSALIIHLEEGDKSMQIFLEPFCIPLSKTLYKADSLRLKKYCSTQDNVNTVFATLSARAEGKLPKIWQNLKNEILESFVTLKAEDDWTVFSLSGHSPSLIREIERLSRTGLCVKMEGKRIAVKKEKLSQFTRKLEAAGFKIMSN